MLEKPNKPILLIWLVVLILLLIPACTLNRLAGETLPAFENTPAGGQELETQPFQSQSTQTAGQPGNILSTSAHPVCSRDKGAVEEYQIIRQDQELTGRVYIPPCYGLDPEQRYPVLYLLHGATETDQQWEKIGITREADRLIRAAVISPVIIVMPRELTWVPLSENRFGDLLVTEIVPWVDQHYLTLNDREYRAIGGLSRGGNWALRIGLLHWGIFGKVGGHSAPLFYGDLLRIPGWIESIPASRYPGIYLDIGHADNNLEQAQQLVKILSGLEIPFQWTINSGLHNEDYWSSQVEDYLIWYSRNWSQPVE